MFTFSKGFVFASHICFALIFFAVWSQEETDVFTHGESGYYCIRIPSILSTVQGTLLAFGEARMFTCHDDTQIDIVVKRSVDFGKTWSKLKVVIYGNDSLSENHNWVGNFAPVQLRYNNRIIVPFCKNNRMLMQTYSDDDGLTFAKAEFIYNVTKSDWKWVALGPPGGLLLKSGRIIIPGDFSPQLQVNAGSISSSFVMINDNNGQIDKWYLGGNFSYEDYFPNECQAVELPSDNGTIFINARSLRTKRIGAYSNDGGITFHKVTVLNNLVQPAYGCEGSTVYHSPTKQIFYSGLATTSTVRTNLSLYTSSDSGENWSYVKSICSGASGYSSMTIMSDQSIGILYEKGDKSGAPATLTFTVVFNQTKFDFS